VVVLSLHVEPGVGSFGLHFLSSVDEAGVGMLVAECVVKTRRKVKGREKCGRTRDVGVGQSTVASRTEQRSHRCIDIPLFSQRLHSHLSLVRNVKLA
jgi:hypothetical protein